MHFFSAIFLGWGLGANDSANVFGTAVSSRMVKFRTAVILAAIFILLGALLQGEEGLTTIKNLSSNSLRGATVVSFAAAITVAFMTFLKLPISTSQAVVGAIVGSSITNGKLNSSGLIKVVICWVGTPIGGFIMSIVLYFLIRKVLQFYKPNIFASDSFYRIGLIIAGCYGAYALGANNVANVTGVFIGDGEGMLTLYQGLLIGGLSIALGVLTFSRNVMMTVGRSIVKLDAYSSLITVLAHAVTVHIYALIGVPVSTSQAIVGAVVGISFIKGFQTLNFPVVIKIFFGWFLTPAMAGMIAFMIYLFF